MCSLRLARSRSDHYSRCSSPRWHRGDGGRGRARHWRRGRERQRRNNRRPLWPTTYLKGQLIALDPAGQLFTAIGAGNLRQVTPAQEDGGSYGTAN
jgi:hypothetical protein